MNKNNTKTGIKKNKKTNEDDGGYKGSRFIRPLHPGLTLNDSYPIYPQDLSHPYPYPPPSSILARSRTPSNQIPPPSPVTTKIKIEMDVETLDDLIHLGKKLERNSNWNHTLSIILI